MLTQFLSWYLVVQLLTLLSLPLAGRLFANLPDRGYSFARILGILLVGVFFWLGYSYGLVRNETGGVWLTVIGFAILNLVIWRLEIARLRDSADTQSPLPSLQSLFPSWRYVLVVELLFLLAFALWATVRANDPAVDHTEEPMDLMFMNSIWTSATFPPQDAWLSGYAISYYYLGYWLLTTLGRLAAQPPEIAYNLGQACWFGLLATGCFGVVYNVLASRIQAVGRRFSRMAATGGLLAVITVALTGNMLGVIEWLHANGVDMKGVGQTLALNQFVEEAQVTNQWHIGESVPWGWVWRTSRVIQDVGLDGGDIEVIDEYPLFSYLLGDNHPHVLAMPIVLLVIGLAFNLLLRAQSPPRPSRLSVAFFHLPALDLLMIVLASGSLVFLNTWDYPAYLALLTLAYLGYLRFRNHSLPAEARNSGLMMIGKAILFDVLLVVGMVAIYLPYWLTAQSQAGGIMPNLFYPTRITQFMVMFGPQVLCLLAMIILAWKSIKVETGKLVVTLIGALGLPLVFLVVGMLAIQRQVQQQGEVPGSLRLADASTYFANFADRWGSQPWTYLLLGVTLALAAALIWQWLDDDSDNVEVQPTSSADIFILFLVAVGVFYAFIPEFAILRDVFGSRMNTIFKFYYQSWLLFGLGAAYVIVRVARAADYEQIAGLAPRILAGVAAMLFATALITPVAGIYIRANRFNNENRTFDATVNIALYSPSEMAAIRWVQTNTAPDALVLEATGDSYKSDHNRISYATGRRTLQGWGGHESQWRGDRYAEMAAGRGEALTGIYTSAPVAELSALLELWKIDYVYVGPVEREKYQMTDAHEQRLADTMERVFEDGNVRIYKRRTS